MNDSRLPPNAVESEKGILGCCLSDTTLVGDLNIEWFYDLRCKLIAEILMGMASNNEAINETNLINRLGKGDVEKAGGSVFIFELQGFGPSAANYPTHRGILVDKLQLRRMVQSSYSAIENAYAADTSRNPSATTDALADFEASTLDIRTHGSDVECEDVKVLMADVIDEMEYDVEHQGELRGVLTGFKDIDDMTNGLRPGQIMIIAARPSVGKSSLAMNIAENISVTNHIPVGFFTFEMTPHELVYRMACSMSLIDSNEAHKGYLTPDDLNKLAKTRAAVVKSNLIISDCVGKNIMQLIGRARRLTRKYGLKLAIVDHLSLVESGLKGASKYESVTYVSHKIKAMARDCGLPVILLAQLNRNLEKEKRSEKRRPILSDLRDSGAIEEDGDIVGLLSMEQENASCLTMLLDIQKNRTGKKGQTWFNFQDTFTRFRPGTNPNHKET